MLKKLKILLDNEIDPAYSRRAEFIFRTIEKERPKKILDIGCGRGFYVHALTFYNFEKEIWGVDNNQGYLSEAKESIQDERVHLLRGTVYSVPFADNYFDAIICSEVLEHLKNDRRALLEIYRVLKKGGSLIVTVPSKDFPLLWDPLNWILMRFFNTHINKNIWFLAGIWADHERLYEVATLTSMIKTAGFSILVSEKIVSFCWPFSHFLLYGIGKNIIEKLNMKNFSRFEYEKSDIKSFLAKVFSFPTKFKIGDSAVDIILLAKK